MKKLLFSAAMLLLLLQCLSAQASLEILLVDSLYKPVAFQAVTVSNEAIGFRRQLASDDNGKIQLDGLSTSGSFAVAVEESMLYQAQTVANIVLVSGKTSSLTLVLREQALTLATATVYGGRFQSINTLDAEVASELRREEIDALPVEGRDISRALFRLPNISQATGFFPEAPNVAINGANPLYTNYQIDGLDNNENFLGGQRFAMPVGFTSSITALTNNFSAEHGLTSNGIINVTSQSGTNTPKFELFSVTRPGPGLDAPSAYAQRDLSGNQVKDGFRRFQYGFAVGGPIVRDKTFFFASLEYIEDIKDNLLSVPQLNINETVRGNNFFRYQSLKLDHHWSEKFRSSLRVNISLVDIERQGGGLEGGNTFPSAANRQDRNSANVAFKNTYIGKKVTLESNYMWGTFRWNYANPDDNGNPDVSILDPSGQFLGFIGHPGYVFDNLENTLLMQQKATFYYKAHRFKAGVQLKSSDFRLFGGGNPNGSYLVQLSQPQLAQLAAAGIGSALSPADLPADVQVLNYGIELRPRAFGRTQNIASFYLEDQWTLSPRLNLNLGLRYDYDNLSVGGGSTGDRNNLAPRLSANYQLNERSALRAGYGIYYDKILYAVYSDALQFNSTATDYRRQLQALIDQGLLPQGTQLDRIVHEGNLVANDPNAAYLQGPGAAELQDRRGQIFQNELRILNPNGYQNPYSHQYMLGYQRKISEQAVFYVDALYNRSENLFRLRNLNAPAPYPIDPQQVVVRSAAAADLSRPVPIFTDASGSYAVQGGDTLRAIARNVVMTETAGSSNYYALNFTLQKDRGEDDYALRLMYTLSYLENNTEDINFRAMDANDFEAEWGPSINDRTHLINGIVSYYPWKNLTLTMAGLLQSGQPINRIPDALLYGTTDLNGDGRSFGDAYVGNSDRSPGEARNSDRLPWSTTFDVNALYQFRFSDGQKIELGLQVFNIFNAVNLSGYANNARQSNQIQPGPASSGLLLRRNAAPPRQFQISYRHLF